jgi:hypothetical protein
MFSTMTFWPKDAGEPLGEDAGEEVRRASRRERHDDPNGAGREGRLRTGEVRCRERRESSENAGQDGATGQVLSEHRRFTPCS